MFTYLLIGLLLLGLVAGVAIALRLASWRLAVPQIEVLGAETIPAAQLDGLRPLADELGAFGMVFAGLQRERRAIGGWWWQALFHSPDGTVWAVAERSGSSKPRLVLYSFFENGRCVTTSSGEFADYDVTDAWRLTEQRWDDLEAQMVFHRQKVLGAGKDRLPVLVAEDLTSRYLEIVSAQFAHLAESGFLVPLPNKPGVFRVIPWKDPRVALKMLLHSIRNRLAERNRQLDAEFQGELQALKEERKRYAGIAEYKYLEYYKEDKKRQSGLDNLGWTKTGAIFLVSIIVLVVFFYAQGALDATTVWIIGGVLLVHDLGHVAMMALFGYRDSHVVFIPLITRLAPEKNMRVSAFKEFLVLLMGPLPGLLIGWGLLVWGYFSPALPEFWRELGLWAVLFNNLNFLAVLPCDGGRVVNLLIFERVPCLRLVYLALSALSVLLSVLIYWITMDVFAWPVLVVLVSTVLAIPDNWRHSKMGPWAKLNLRPEDSEYDALMKAFQIVELTDSTRGLEKRGWTSFVDRVVRYGCARKLGFFPTVGCLVLFFFFLYTPFFVLGGLAFSDAMIVAGQGEKLDSRLEAWRPAESGKAKPLGERTAEGLALLEAAYTRDRLMVRGGALEEEDHYVGYAPGAAGDDEERSDLEVVRVIDWNEAMSWVAEEDSMQREEVLAFAIRLLIESAAEGIDLDEVDTPLSDLSRAWWGLTTCEPRTSLGRWIDWLYLEGAMLEQLERLSSRGELPPRYVRYFLKEIPGGPQPGGRKLAYLLLRDLKAEEAGAGLQIDAAQLEAAREDPFSIGGFRLRRSQADRDYLASQKDGGGLADVRKLLGWSRALRGLPTAEDFHAGLIVAEAWEGQELVERVPLDDLANDEQRELWKARFDAMQRLLHFRKLAVAALEIENAEAERGVGRHQMTNAGRLPVPVKMEDLGGDFALKATAPDGTELSWRLSPPPLQ